MSAFIATLRSGDWLTRERMRIWSLAILAATLLGAGFLIVTSDGLNDYQGRPLGTDYSNVYAAGTYVLDGKPGAPFDWRAQFEREKVIFGPDTPFYGWHYPPFFLFVAGLLALMPYTLSLAVYQAVTLVLFLFCIHAIAARYAPQTLAGRDRMWLLLALAFPAVLVNIGHGHNGFLTAALLGAALLLVDRRPVLAGILFGLMSYKPQFGVLIPLVLLATGRWRAFAAATATVLALVGATLVAFGPDVWLAFQASLPLTRVHVLEQGGTGWHKIQSAFAMVRMWDGGVALAYAVQGSVTLVLAASLAWLWRSNASFPLKAAALSIAAIAATPYSLDYDFVILGPAIAFLVADGLTRGFANWEKSALALLWLMPLIARPVAEQLVIPLGVPLMLIVFVLIVRRAALDVGLRGGRSMATQPVQ